MNRSDAMPTIAALTGPGEPLPPGFEQLDGEARLLHADDLGSLRAALAEADVLVVTDFNSDIVPEAWDAAERLQWVHATSAGVDRLMFPALVESEVPLTNAAGIFDKTIAEYVLGLIIAYAKDLPRTLELQRQHQWQHRDNERVDDKSVLVVGAGSIGRQIARLCKAVDLYVEGMGSRPREGDDDFAVIHGSDQLNEVVGRFDYVVIAAPLTDSTRGMFDTAALRSMKSTARLINIGRGPIVDTDALVEALRSDEIAGAALDVFEQEPLPEDHPLWDLPGVIVSPHMAGDYVGWRRALVDQFVENFRRWRRGEPLMNLVDKRRGYGARGSGAKA